MIEEMKGMDISTSCAHLEGYGFYNAYYEYENTAYHKGTREEINSYISEKLENRAFSYYFSRKFADFAGLFMGFFATVLLPVLFMQDTRGNTYELRFCFFILCIPIWEAGMRKASMDIMADR